MRPAALLSSPIIDSDPALLAMPPLPTPPYTPEPDALIVVAMVGFRLDGKARRLILNASAADGA